MQNLSEGLLEAAEVKIKQQLTFTVNQAFTMKSFADAIAIINKNRENQILGLQQKIKCLHRQVTTLNLKISSQSFTISSEVYTSSETAVQDENLSMKYIKLRDLLKLSSFNDD
ncbi:uncharacterized protein BDCG_17894 [Blastomyces dermatitidis ER-3]|uniref:Uncharacterized protein n=1 Tax=Ajellomyces dermatitidis (strain ER-3 / ATCC MYA-2586) TaxID=559297 RepID=A0ABX2W0W2_AJEDR|nr:uncharacterized protein BDCG_17894 [Blastomyces dermatitidis ER-3]OAT03023.1 hypothetical protein BDCG_17894 [Blastomyces dermatitidis ER-3]